MKMNERTRLARQYFKFVLKAFQETEYSTLPMQPYIFFLCYWISRLWSGKRKKLLINIAPKHLKTFIGSVCLVAWELAHRPGSDILVVTGSEKLVTDIAPRILRLLQSKWYIKHYGRCLSRNNVDPTNFRTIHGGTVHVIAIGSNFTGLRADLIIVDDPHDVARMQSLAKIQTVKDTYRRGVKTRFNNPKSGRTLVMHHRIHVEDLASELAKDADFKCIALPLIAPRTRTYRFGGEVWLRRAGDVLRPDEYTPKKIAELRAEPEWPLLYQQGVDPGSDLRLKRNCFVIRDRRELIEGPCVISVDPGQGNDTGSFSCFQVWIPVGVHGHQLVDQIRERASFERQCDILRYLRTKYRPAAILIENTALGPALIEFARNRLQCKVVAISPHSRSKFERLQAVARLFRNRAVTLFRDAPYVELLLQEADEFPYGTFDDQIDAMTQYLEWVTTPGNLPLTATPRPGVITGVGGYGQPLSSIGLRTASAKGIAVAFGSRFRRW
jgi:predicted phage terminase large subunit-like protein